MEITRTTAGVTVVGEGDVGVRVGDAYGRVGILREVMHDFEDPGTPVAQRRKIPVAFVWDEKSGREWLLSPETLERM